MELYGVMAEAAHATASLAAWMAPTEVASPPPAHASVSKIYRDPLGTVLIIGACVELYILSYPFNNASSSETSANLRPSYDARRVELSRLPHIDSNGWGHRGGQHGVHQDAVAEVQRGLVEV